MIQRIQSQGIFLNDCPLPGESKQDMVWPGQANAVQLSRDRWLIVYATRGMRFMDDDRSIHYQLRADGPDGVILREGILSRSFDGWDPEGDGRRCFKQHGHPVVFGVPKGTRFGGKPVPHENLFVAKWRVVGIFDHGPIEDAQLPPEELQLYQGIKRVSHKINKRYGWGQSLGQDAQWMLV